MRGAGLLMVLGACQAGLADEAAPAVLDRGYFDCAVQPIVTKWCSSFACHGSGSRPFRVYAPNRLRLGGTEADRGAPIREDELSFNYASAAGFVDAADPDSSLFLMKPLDERAGGSYHEGAELFGGGDVFLSIEDREFETLAAWVHGAVMGPSCTSP